MLKKIHFLFILITIAFMTSNSLCLRIPDDNTNTKEVLEKAEVDGLKPGVTVGGYLSLYSDIRMFQNQGLEDKIDERLMIESALTTKKEVLDYKKEFLKALKFYPKIYKNAKEEFSHIDEKYPKGKTSKALREDVE